MRVTELTIAGKTYPVCLSTGAAKKIADRYGDIAKVGDVLQNKPLAEALGELNWLLALLVKAGCDYKQYSEGQHIEPITEDALECVLGLDDVQQLQTDVFVALTGGMKREVEVDEKNAEATQNT